YSVTIGDSYCHVQTTLTLPVIVNPNPVLSVSKNNDITCSQPFSQLKVTGAMKYLWSPSAFLNNAGIDNPVATVNSTTSFVVTGTNVNGCESTDSVKVNFIN